MTTQFATASYQEIIDLHTETDKVSVLGIHTPVNRTPYDMLSGFFDSFQKYHYDGCSFTMVPAARLPADPSQVSYGAGEPPIDPRDLLNPILWHGCHGESLGAVLNQFYSGALGTSDIERELSTSLDHSEISTTQIGNPAIFDSLYYRALTDNTWLKAHPQKGFRKSGLKPLVYSISTDKQFTNGLYGAYSPRLPVASVTAQPPEYNYGVATSNYMNLAGTMGTDGTNPGLNAESSEGLQYTTSGGSVQMQPNYGDQQFFTSKLHGLGWLDTRNRLLDTYRSASLSGDPSSDSQVMQSFYANTEERQKYNYLPRLFMGICLLPPAYKTEQWFRVILNHRFSFKKFRGISMRGDFSGAVGPGRAPSYFNFNN